jgi:hypothetical protein
MKQSAAIAGLLALNIAAYFINVLDSKKWVSKVSESRATILCVCATWLALTAVATVLSRIPCRPSAYYDGPYVYKVDTQSTRIQALFGDLPCDNALPHVVAEFLLRDISFAVERPVMPGQEVANRPILMSLVVVPFRAAFDPPPILHGRLGRFNYVGSSWPDIAPLLSDWEFSQFLSVALLLNATWILGVLWILSVTATPPVVALLGVLAFATSYYVLCQTVFTWPKAAASFWIIAAFMARLADYRFCGWGELSQQKAAAAGGCLGVAFWMHPLAVLFFVASILVQIGTAVAVRSRRSIENALVSVVAFVVVVAPWIAWTRLVLGIPSDLLSQNVRMTESLSTALWVRGANLYHVWVPVCFDTRPVTYAMFMDSWWLTLSASCGITVAALLYLAAHHNAFLHETSWRAMAIECFALPGMLICSVFGFNNPACLLHGFQVHVAALMPAVFLTSPKLAQRPLVWLTAACVILQIAGNLAYSVAQFDRRYKNAASLHVTESTSLLNHPSLRVAEEPLPVNRSAQITLAGIERSCLWLNAPAKVTIGPLRVGSHRSISGWIGIHEHVLPIIPAKGIDFRLIVRAEGRVIASQINNLSPATRAEDRGWHRVELILPKDHGEEVTLCLDVGDTQLEGHIDWCLWSDVRLQP